MYDADITARTPRPFATFERLESKVRSYSRSFPAIFSRASGSWLYDDGGHAFLDFLSGCASLNYGHNHPALKARLLEYIAADGGWFKRVVEHQRAFMTRWKPAGTYRSEFK